MKEIYSIKRSAMIRTKTKMYKEQQWRNEHKRRAGRAASKQTARATMGEVLAARK